MNNISGSSYNGIKLKSFIKNIDNFTETCTVLTDNIGIDFDAVQQIRCGAHSFRLTVKDALASKSYILEKFRQLAKFLRTPILHNNIMSKKLKLIAKENDTRWNSLCAMFKSV